MTTILAAGLAGLCVLLAGCGQKGPLSLPVQVAPAAPAGAASAASAASPTVPR